MTSPMKETTSPVLLVFAPDTGSGGTVLEILTAWSGLGLLHDVIWVDQKSGDTRGSLITEEGAHDVVIAEELAARNLTAIRTVSLVTITSDDEAQAAPTGAEELGRHNRFRQMAAEATIPYVGGVIAAPSAGSTVPHRVFDAGFTFNFLVVPEDRVADDRVGVPITVESLPASAACALASATGLWFWSNSAIIDSLRPEGGSVDPRIRLIRSFVRVADGGSSIDDIVDSSLSLSQTDGQWPLPNGLVPAPLPADDPIGSIGGIVNDFTQHYGIAFAPRQPPGVPPPTQMGLIAGLKLFASTFVRILQQIPVEWVRHKQVEVTEAVLRYFTDKTFTADSSIILTLRGHSLPTSATIPTGDNRRREIVGVQMPGSDVITPEPMLWEGFRAVACGMADASALPAGVNSPVRGAARLLITTPDLIAPDADPSLAFSDDALPGVELLTCDAFGASELHHLLEEALAPPAPDTSDAGTDTASELASEDGEVQEPQPVPDAKASDSATVLSGLSRDQLQRLLGKLDSWTGERSRNKSFAWRVGSALGDAIQSASEELAGALLRIGAGEPSVDNATQIEESRKFTRFLRVGLLVVLILIAGVAGMAIAGLLSIIVALSVIVVILVVSAGGGLRQFLKFVRSQTRAEFERNQQTDEYWFAFTRAYLAATAITRFCALYWQYLDWARTVAFLVREPWGRGDEAEATGTLEDAPHPLSMIIARAELPADQFQRSVAAAQQLAITPGWLREAFDWHVDASGKRYRLLMNAPDDADSDPTHDSSLIGTVAGRHAATGEVILRPRGQVESDAEGGRFGPEIRSSQAEQIVESTLRHALEDLFSDVEVPPPAGRGKTGDGLMEFLSYIVPTDEALPSSFPGALFQVEELRSPNVIEVTLPSAVTPKSAPLPSVARIQGTWRAEYGRPFMVGAHRVDLSSVFRPDELRSIASVERAQEDLPLPTADTTPPVIP
jgi:hypothetical protein